MTELEEKELVAGVLDKLGPGYVHVQNAGARGAFLKGEVLFDVIPNGKRLGEFFEKNADLERLASKTESNTWRVAPLAKWGFANSSIWITVHKEIWQAQAHYEAGQAGIELLRSLGMLDGQISN